MERPRVAIPKCLSEVEVSQPPFSLGLLACGRASVEALGEDLPSRMVRIVPCACGPLLLLPEPPQK
jgi:hypothetical protein